MDNQPKEKIVVTLTVHSVNGHDVIEESLDKVVGTICDLVRKTGKWLYVAGERVRLDPDDAASVAAVTEKLSVAPTARMTGSLRGGALAADFSIAQLREMAKGGVVPGYSQLPKTMLFDRLVEVGAIRGSAPSPAKKATAKKTTAKKAAGASTSTNENLVVDARTEAGRRVHVVESMSPPDPNFKEAILVKVNSKSRILRIEVNPQSTKPVIVETLSALQLWMKKAGVLA